MDFSEELIKLIDERIEKKINSSNFVKQYTGKVTQDYSDSTVYIQVQLLGYDTKFSFLNKTGITAFKKGDIVKIECVNNQLSSGYIVQKF